MDHNIGDSLSALRKKHLKLSQADFAERLDIPLRTYQSYEQNKVTIPHSFLLKLKTSFDVSIDWLLAGEGNEYIEHGIDEETKLLFSEAYKISQVYSVDLNDNLRKFIMDATLSRIKEIRRSETFWDKVFFNSYNTVSYARVLTRALVDAKKKYTTEVITPANAKEILKKIIEDYELKLFKDKINNGLSQLRKDELVKFIDEEFDDVGCYVVLTDFDTSVEAIREVFTGFDGFMLKLK